MNMRAVIRYALLIVCILAIEFTALFSPIERMGAVLSGILQPLKQEIRVDRNNCGACSVDTARLRALESENAQLREQLKFTERFNMLPLIARRIGRSTDPLQSEVVIDRGARDGVAVGDPVIANDGILVGIIQNTDQTKSYVLSLTDPRSKILATILQDKKEIRGIAEGQYNTGLTMTLIPISEELRKDDLAITSGLQDRIPAGLVIGTVQDIQKKPEDLFQSAILRTALPIDEIGLMSVLIRQDATR